MPGVVFAILSELSLVVYWNYFGRFFNKVGAIGINGWILIRLLIMEWLSETDLGIQSNMKALVE